MPVLTNLISTRKSSVARRAHALNERECMILDRIGRDRAHKDIAAELGVSINRVANVASKADPSSARTARSQRASLL